MLQKMTSFLTLQLVSFNNMLGKHGLNILHIQMQLDAF